MKIKLEEIGIMLTLSPIGDGELPFSEGEFDQDHRGILLSTMNIIINYIKATNKHKILKNLEVTKKEDISFTRDVPDLNNNIPQDKWDLKGKNKAVSSAGRASNLTPDVLVDMYNSMAKPLHWQQCKVIGDDLRKKLLIFIKKHPDASYWETVFKGWQSNAFYSGRSGIYTRVKIRTMVVSSRYEEFYEDGLDLDDPTPKPPTHADKMTSYLNDLLAGKIDGDGNPLC